jgi:hypothetical protein
LPPHTEPLKVTPQPAQWLIPSCVTLAVDRGAFERSIRWGGFVQRTLRVRPDANALPTELSELTCAASSATVGFFENAADEKFYP